MEQRMVGGDTALHQAVMACHGCGPESLDQSTRELSRISVSREIERRPSLPYPKHE